MRYGSSHSLSAMKVLLSPEGYRGPTGQGAFWDTIDGQAGSLVDAGVRQSMWPPLRLDRLCRT